MLVRWPRSALRFATALFAMFRLTWNAYSAGMVGIVLLDLVQGMLPLATAWLTKLLFDLLAHTVVLGTPGVIPPGLFPLLAGQVLLVVTGPVLIALSAYLNTELGRRLTFDVELQVYQKINDLAGLAPFEDPQFHQTLQLAASEAQRGPAQLLTLVTTLGRSVLTIIGFLGILLAWDPLLAGVVGLAVLPQLWVRLKLSQQRVQLAAATGANERQLWYYRQVLSGLSFAKEVRLFNLADYFLAAFRRTYQAIHQVQRGQQRREVCWQTLLALIGSGLNAGVFVAVVLAAFAGRLSLGDVTLYVSAVASVQAALAGMVVALASLHESVLFHTYFTELLALPQPFPIARPARPVPPLTQAIELHNVSFRYTGQRAWVLRHVNLRLPVGQCLALVGLNGAGKTTLTKLLLRLYDPTEGQILWDGIDIREFDPAELRRHMGVIFQDFVRYDLTVQENIGLGNVAQLQNLARIRQAAQAAGIDAVIEHLPQDYDTNLSRWLDAAAPGTDLSGGEWQKIALARLFMRETDLLVLDEPTAALDGQAEEALYHRFRMLMRGHTSLLITHRFSTVRLADVVAVLEAGQVSEVGSHAELIARGGTYAILYNLQADHYRDSTPNPWGGPPAVAHL